MSENQQRSKRPSHGKRVSPPNQTVKGDVRGSISVPVLGLTELAKAAFILTNVIAASPSDIVFGEKREYPNDPILEAYRLILNRKVCMRIERMVVPGEPRSIESFDIRDMVFDMDYLGCIMEFREDNTVLPRGTNVRNLIKEIEDLKEISMEYNVIYDDDITRGNKKGAK